MNCEPVGGSEAAELVITCLRPMAVSPQQWMRGTLHACHRRGIADLVRYSVGRDDAHFVIATRHEQVCTGTGVCEAIGAIVAQATHHAARADKAPPPAETNMSDAAHEALGYLGL